ncbi:MAG TPA: glycosyltransferase [Gemmatimonadales bacterium]
MINGGVYRPTELLRAAARQGWQVTAISQLAPAEPSDAGLELVRSVPASVRLTHFEPPPARDPSHFFSPRLSGGFGNIEPIITAALRECAAHRPTAVMASGPPFAEFVAALVLSREWDVPLVLDYRDEWTECPFQFVGVGNVDRYWEARCLSKAALVCFTTESQRAHQISAFPQLGPARTMVAPNGWEEHHSGSSPATVLTPGVATIAFLGLLAEHCDLPEFLATLERVMTLTPATAQRIQFAFVGRKTTTEQQLLERFSRPALLRDIGHVPLSEAQAIMRTSDALLLFNVPRLARYIPGKAYDYIAAGRRILLYGQGGELERLLSEYPPAIRVERGDPQALASAMAKIAAAKVEPGTSDGSEFVARHRRSLSAERQLAAIERVARQNRSGHPVA